MSVRVPMVLGSLALGTLVVVFGCARPVEQPPQQEKSVARGPVEEPDKLPKSGARKAVRGTAVSFDEFEEFLETPEEQPAPETKAPVAAAVPEDLGGVFAPGSDAAEAGRTAIGLYDRDGDGAIAGDEIQACPALAAALERIDADGDGRITGGEIAARIQSWKDARAGLLDCGCRVLLDGQPLAGATVVLEPESFLPPSVRTCRGLTDPQGIAIVSIPDADPPGAHPGFYKVRITHETVELPQRYNVETTLGVELSPDAASGGLLEFELKPGGDGSAAGGSDVSPPAAREAPPGPPVGKPLELPEPGGELRPINAAESDDPDNPFVPELPKGEAPGKAPAVRD